MLVRLKDESGNVIARGTLASFMAEQDCGYIFADGTERGADMPEAELLAMLQQGPVVFGGGAFAVSILELEPAPYGRFLPLFTCLDYAPLTAERIENEAERLMSRADKALMTTETTQAQYDLWCVALRRWCEEQYRVMDARGSLAASRARSLARP